jgi:putative transposase
MLSDKNSYYKENKKILYITPAKYKKEYPFLKEVDSLSLANVQLNLDRAFKAFYKKNS